MSPENYQRVVQALRNTSVLVAAHVDGAEHGFATRQLQLSIALLLNELASNRQAPDAERGFSSRMPPRTERPDAAVDLVRSKQVADA